MPALAAADAPQAATQIPPQTATIAPLSAYHKAIYDAIDDNKAHIAAYWSGIYHAAFFWAVILTILTSAYLLRPARGYPDLWRSISNRERSSISFFAVLPRVLARLPSVIGWFLGFSVLAFVVLFFISPLKPDGLDRYKIAQDCTLYQQAIDANEVDHFPPQQQALSDRETYEIIDQCWQRTHMTDHAAYALYATAVKEGFISPTGQLYYGRNFDPYLGFREFAQAEKD